MNDDRVYLRAAAGLLPGRHRSATLPERELVRPGVAVDRDHLATYDRVCGFRLTDALPATYPHVLAFPLAMRLMTAADFPFPVIGLVHIANRITVSRPIDAAERLDLSVHATDLRDHARGRQFDIEATATVDGEEVWRGVSTYLRREAEKDQRNKAARDRPEPATPDGLQEAPEVRREAASGSRHEDAAGNLGEAGRGDRHEDATAKPGEAGREGQREDAAGSLGETGRGDRRTGNEGDRRDQGGRAATAVWRVPAKVGREYAAVSGDRNPIHTSRLGARLLGFSGPIAHGMWSKARGLAALDGRLPAEYTVDVAFRAPILLPGTVSFRVEGLNFELFGRRPHLAGLVTHP